MSGRTGVTWRIELYTQAKHEILIYYLRAWFPILATTQRRLVYVDGFAGPGEYDEEEDGSPKLWIFHFLLGTILHTLRLH